MNIKRTVYRKFSVILPLFVIVAQWLMPLATAEKVKADNLSDELSASPSKANTPTLAEIDARFTQLVENYAAAPDVEPEQAFNRSFSFAMSVSANRAARAEALALAVVDGADGQETAPTLSPQLLETAFIKLYQSYAIIPADFEPEIRARMEYAFSIAGNALVA